jgi:hypothetical protein
MYSSFHKTYGIIYDSNYSFVVFPKKTFYNLEINKLKLISFSGFFETNDENILCKLTVPFQFNFGLGKNLKKIINKKFFPTNEFEASFLKLLLIDNIKMILEKKCTLLK